MRRALYGVLLAVVVTACPADPDNVFANASARPACAPFDGPAIQFDFHLAGGSNRTLTAVIYRSPAEADGKTWSIAPPHEFGTASLCDANQSCENAASGEMRFAPGSAALRGVLDIRFPVAGRIRSAFDAGWLEIAVICG